MIQNKKMVFALAGLIVIVGIIWLIGSPDNQLTAMISPAPTVTITPGPVAEGGTPDQTVAATQSKTANSTAAAKKTASPTASQPASTTQTAVPTPTQTMPSTATPTQSAQPSQTAVTTPATTSTPIKTPIPTQTATATPEPTQGYSYSVYNDDGVAPAGYTIVYVKITPGGSYRVTYDGSTITKSKSGSGSITYYKTVEKLEGGGYRSKVRVSAN